MKPIVVHVKWQKWHLTCQRRSRQEYAQGQRRRLRKRMYSSSIKLQGSILPETPDYRRCFNRLRGDIDIKNSNTVRTQADSRRTSLLMRKATSPWDRNGTPYEVKDDLMQVTQLCPTKTKAVISPITRKAKTPKHAVYTPRTRWRRRRRSDDASQRTDKLSQNRICGTPQKQKWTTLWS